MTQTGADKGKTIDWISDRILRGLIAALRALPYGRRVALMGWVARRIIGPVAGYRKRAEENLAMIWPDMPESARRAVAQASLDNFGRTLIENYSGADLSARLAATEPRGEGMQALADARANGRAVIFVTGHFGNHEAPRHVLDRLGYTIGGLYRAMRNPWFNAHYARTMEDVSGPVFEQGSGTIGFVRHLRAGGMMTILFDVHDMNGERLDFLGQPTLTSFSAAELALRLDAEVIPYFGIRAANGLDFDIAVETPITRGTAEQMMREMTDRLEARIAENPGQWFWVHRRWKPEKLSRQRRLAAARMRPGPLS